MTPREIAKKVAGVIVQYGSAIIVNGIIKNNVDTSRIDNKIAVGLSSIALGGIVADATANRSDKIVDDIFDTIDEIKKKF